MKTSSVRVFVLHVKEGYEERARHMESMLAGLGIEFEYMLDGDIGDITQERSQRYFSGERSRPGPITSCALKHLLIYEKIVEEKIPYALVLEDDIYLKRRFTEVFARSVEELWLIDEADPRPRMVSYEATFLRLVPRSLREKGRVIYPGEVLQCMGAYLVNNQYARQVIERTAEGKCSQPFDLHVDRLRGEEQLLELYWSYPVVAEQGSHNGKMETALGNPLTGRRWWIKIRRRLTMMYKEVIYYFR